MYLIRLFCGNSRLHSTEKDKPVALYCRSGKRSKKAAAILSEKDTWFFTTSTKVSKNGKKPERRK